MAIESLDTWTLPQHSPSAWRTAAVYLCCTRNDSIQPRAHENMHAPVLYVCSALLPATTRQCMHHIERKLRCRQTMDMGGNRTATTKISSVNRNRIQYVEPLANTRTLSPLDTLYTIHLEHYYEMQKIEREKKWMKPVYNWNQSNIVFFVCAAFKHQMGKSVWKNM